MLIKTDIKEIMDKNNTLLNSACDFEIKDNFDE